MYFHDFKILLNDLIEFDKPINIASPIKKWPMLNSLMPFNFDKIFADW